MKIIIDAGIPYIKGVFEPYSQVGYVNGSAIGCSDIAGADALIVRTRTRCGRELLENSSLRLIVSATVGDDHIDVEYCREAGIKVITAAGCNAGGVLQWVAAVLAHQSEISEWVPSRKTIGIVGVGNVGRLVDLYCRMWGFEVRLCDPPRRRTEGGDFADFDTIAAECDIITFHVPLIFSGGDRTFGMAGSDFFSRIRKNSLIINSSRGEVADTAALTEAVRGGLCSCCIDTWENEPYIDRELLRLSSLSTPHIAGYSAQGKANASAFAVRAVASEFGFPLSDWYPIQYVRPVARSPIPWEEMKATIAGYFDIVSQSRDLKSSPERFEEFRNNYNYRQEYF